MTPVLRSARRRAAAGLLGALLGCVAALAEEPGDAARHEAELKRLRQNIGALEQRLAAGFAEKSQLAGQLRELEKNLGRVSREIRDRETEIEVRSAQLERLLGEQKGLRSTLARHRVNLRRQILAAHRVGRLQALQLVLNQQDPALVSRVLTYASYLNRARVQAIDSTRETVARLAEVVRDTERERVAVERARDALLGQHRALEQRRTTRAEVLAALERELATGGRQLQGMQSDRARLEELLRSLNQLLADIPAAPLQRRPFRSLRGQLPWPAKGRVVKRFNSARGVGDLKWRGILIAADMGNNVRAVHHGRVVFADWLAGFGLLAIVEHDDGYMSLYGYAQSLLKEVGEWVEPGDVIATVGDSGGQSTSGLYFEVRKGGKPTDPQRWIARRYRQAGAG